MKFRSVIFSLAAVAFAFGLAGCNRQVLGVCLPRMTDHMGLMTSSQGSREVKVLFVGNSLTYVNDLPGTLIKVANSDPQSPVKLIVGSNTIPDATLKQLYADGCGLKRIRAEHFDSVVLQEHSFFWFQPGDVEDAREALGNWTSAIRQSGGSPEYFEPWVGAQGGDPGYANVGDMTSAVHANADLYSVPIVRVGEAFAEAQAAPGAPDLLSSDGHHPSPAGTYFAALVFFHHFTSEPAERATWRPDGVSADQAASLARIADTYS